MADTLKDLLGWYRRDLDRHARFASHVQLVGQTSGAESDGSREDHTTLQLYTDRNRYRLTVVERWAAGGVPAAGYLGCTASARKSRAGEDWNRGSDLADGVLCEDTWLRILRDIVAYELVQVYQGAVGDRLQLPGPFDLPPLGGGRGAAVAQAQDAGTAFLRRLATERGAIVSSGDCDHMEIANARATGRFWVDADGLGYVLRTKEWLQRIHAADGYMQAKAPPIRPAAIDPETLAENGYHGPKARDLRDPPA